MKIFDKDGLLLIPYDIKDEIKEIKKVVVIKECFCPNGHNLIDKKASFNGNSGILIKAKKKNGQEGLIALSPIYGDKTRVALNIELENGEILELLCPHCNVALPTYSKCHCGGDLKAMFLVPKEDFTNCVGICNKVDCPNAEIKAGGELLNYSIIDRS